MNYRVVADRKAEKRKPVKVFRGDIITPIEESNPAGDWPNWIYCNTG
ncbi:hypothetical protein [Vallitalea okinawensis]|nr:hypothetical protein [Vallitalea okinawensis]